MNIRLPRARATDPSTSHDAAASIDEDTLLKSQQAVLGVLRRLWTGATDEILIYHYRVASVRNHLGYPRQSESGIRTRRKELVSKGLVYDTGRTERTSSGRKAIVWGAHARRDS